MIRPEPGSFRDRSNRVYYAEGAIMRGVSQDTLGHWERLAQEAFFQKLLSKGSLVPTTLLDRKEKPAAAIIGEGWAGVLQHERIPFVTYPYEWTFGMLKDAALLHLDILERAVDAGWTLKDATAYNVQWRGARPCFIDVASFEPRTEGDAWIGYRQFCMMYLIPLMLKAYRDIDYIPFLRSNLEGIDPAEATKILPWTSLFKKGVFSHVWLHARLQKAFAGNNADGQNGQPRRIRHSRAMVLGTIQGLRRTVEKLKLRHAPTTWSYYDETHSYDDGSYRAKQDFVSGHVGKKRWSMVWDIGCNTGTFSRLCAPHAGTVVSIDGDAMAIERLYQRQEQEPQGNILPLVMALNNVSPGQGWRGKERKALEERGTPDFLLCLALIHHIVISANVPMCEFIKWLRGLGAAIVIEFVGPEDEMTRRLLRNRVNQYGDYTQANFESIVAEMFTIVDSAPLKNGLRKIYYLEPKN